MKKFLSILMVAVMIVSVCALGACTTGVEKTTEPKTDVATEKDTTAATEPETVGATMTLVLMTETPTVLTVNLNGLTVDKGLISVLDALKAQEKLTYTDDNGFLTQVGELTQDSAAGVYLYLYTTVAADADVSEYASEITYDGKKIPSSGVGATAMHIEEGCTIVIGIITYGA